MINLTDKFKEKSLTNSTDKVIIAHVYYDDTNFYRFSTSTVTIDNNQYLGLIDDLVDSSHVWNINDPQENNITVCTPIIIIKNYQNILDTDSLLERFFSKTFSGRKCKIYFGYNGISLSDFLEVFDGIIDDFESDGKTIKIKMRNFEISDKSISGRKIDPVNKIIGSIEYMDINIPTETANKTIPVIFGNHWNAPLQLFHIDDDDHRYYSVFDDDYAPLYTCSIMPMYLTNVHQNYQEVIYVEDSDYLVPINKLPYDITSSMMNNLNFTASLEKATRLNSILFSNYNETPNVGTNDNILATVPLRLFAVTSGSFVSESGFYNPNYFSIGGLTGTAALQTSSLNAVFAVSNSIYMRSPTTASSYVEFKFGAKCPLSRNLRYTFSGSIMPNWKIHVPENATSFPFAYFYKSHYDSNTYHRGFVTIHSFLNYDVSNDRTKMFPFVDSFQSNKNYIGSTLIPKIFDTEFTSSNAINNQILLNDTNIWMTPMNYQFTLDSFHTSSGQTDWGSNKLGNFGDVYASEDMGNYPELTREALERKVGMRVGIVINTAGNYKSVISFNGLMPVFLSSLDFGKDKNIYSHAKSNIGSKNLDYLSFIINNHLNKNVNFAASASSFFGTSRNGSGFCLNEEISLKDFSEEFLKYEPFTMYPDESENYRLIHLRANYSQSNVDGILDYNDCTDFDTYMTPSDKLIAEIKNVQTDYVYATGKYCNSNHYKIKNYIGYDFTYWKADNSYAENTFILNELNKKYTSYVEPDKVLYAGKNYSCVHQNTGYAPSDNPVYWQEMTPVSHSLTTWNSSTEYWGADRESYVIAKYIINQYCNRHRCVRFETEKLSYMKFQIGDIIKFQNVPFSLLGMNIYGFNNSTNWTTTLNGQEVFGAFIITEIEKNIEKISISCMQLHNLASFNIDNLSPVEEIA